MLGCVWEIKFVEGKSNVRNFPFFFQIVSYWPLLLSKLTQPLIRFPFSCIKKLTYSSLFLYYWTNWRMQALKVLWTWKQSKMEGQTLHVWRKIHSQSISSRYLVTTTPKTKTQPNFIEDDQLWSGVFMAPPWYPM